MKEKVCHEIGKLEDGNHDPCLDCINSDTLTCDNCMDYNRYSRGGKVHNEREGMGQP